MKILAIDIGGTYSRFGHFELDLSATIHPLVTHRILTQGENINSFDDLLSNFSNDRPEQFLNYNDYDAITLSVPGPVYKDVCLPPNINWPIELRSLKKSCRVFMLNDFAAQAYACLLPEIESKLQQIKDGHSEQSGPIAIVGAGTGLGHSTLLAKANTGTGTDYIVLSSEAGHSTFSFIGETEKRFEVFLKEKLNVSYCVNDNVVNGLGICLLHEFLTGEKLTAESIFFDTEKNSETINLFSRFYARVCRNYCLGNMITNRLIISAGLAAKNPQLVNSKEFFREFLNVTSASYQKILENLPVYLNKFDDIGLVGAVLYAKTRA